MERDRERWIKRDREKRLSCPGRIRESIFARRAVNDLIRLIVCSALLLPRARARFMQRWRSDIRTNDNALFPAIAPRAGSYGVTTRSRDKWITTDYAHRTEINSAAIASRRADEKNWNGMDDLEHKGAVEGWRRADRWKVGKKYVFYLSRSSASSATTGLKMGNGW